MSNMFFSFWVKMARLAITLSTAYDFRPLLVDVVPVVCVPSLQTLSEQITRYFNDVVDQTDETLGKSYSGRALRCLQPRVCPELSI